MTATGAALTTEQVLALLPGSPAQKAARGLATPRPWTGLGRSADALWGDCRGSAKDPYSVAVHLEGPAYKCSCPSPRHPCKHAAGLMLLVAEQPATVTAEAPPDWVTEWLTARVQRAERKAARAAEPPSVDVEAQARRAAQREERVNDGVAELSQALHDVMRRGLGAVQQEGPAFWFRLAARMTDAQAPGLATRVEALSRIAGADEDSTARPVEQVSLLHLLARGHARLSDLAPPLRATVRTQLGWSQSQADLAVRPGTADRWLVVGSVLATNGSLRSRRTWLVGAESHQIHLLVDHAHGTVAFETSYAVGSQMIAEVIPYDGAFPLRVIVKHRSVIQAPAARCLPTATIRECMDQYARAISLDPWIAWFPMLLANTIPVEHGGAMLAVDEAGHALPLSWSLEQAWPLIAQSGGRPLDLFGEWDGQRLTPLSVLDTSGGARPLTECIE
ncbi:MAG: SWIM zinc finger family protein [Chloroflexota bacterium]